MFNISKACIGFFVCAVARDYSQSTRCKSSYPDFLGNRLRL